MGKFLAFEDIHKGFEFLMELHTPRIKNYSQFRPLVGFSVTCTKKHADIMFLSFYIL